MSQEVTISHNKLTNVDGSPRTSVVQLESLSAWEQAGWSAVPDSLQAAKEAVAAADVPIEAVAAPVVAPVAPVDETQHAES